MSCSELLRLGHDEVDVLRSARPEGKNCRLKLTYSMLYQ